MHTKPMMLTFTAAFLMTSLGASAPALADNRVSVMVFDASGSMWERLEDDRSRIEIAREVIDEFAASRDSSVPFGLVAYGHNRRGDCEDIETVLPLDTWDRGEISRAVVELNPQGMTPLTDSMALAREMIPRTAESADIILVTDGLENCGGDPCALAAEMAAEGFNIRAHVVGFALEEEAVKTLACVPEQTGGQLFTTQSGDELSAALAEIVEARPEAIIHAPENASAGATVEVRWEGPEEEGDFIVVVEPGAPEGASGHSRRASSSVQGKESVDIQMPDALGTHELRYVYGATDATLATHEIGLEPVEARVSAPEEIRAGASFEVEWEGPVNRNDYIVIVEAGAPNDDTGHSRRAWERVSEDGEPVTIQAPDALGTHEVRYVVRDSRRVLASQEVNLTPVEASVSAPQEIGAGASFEVQWEGPVNRGDYIVIVEAGAPNDDTGHSRRAWQRVSEDGEPVTIQAPDALGTHEVRYVVRDSRRVLASQEVTLTPVEASLEAPETVLPGSDFEVRWEGPQNRRDFIAIVEPDAPEGDSGHSRRASSQARGETVTLTAPDDEGDYEIRYVINDSDRTLAAIPITVGRMEVSLEAEPTVSTGGVVEVSFTGPGRYEDLIEIVEAGAAPDDAAVQDARASQGSPVQLFAPSRPGSYEIRYRASDSGEVLASIELEVE